MEISHAEDITPRDTVSPIDDEELHQFTSDTKNWLDDTLKKLKWTEDYLLESEEMAQCPLNAAHYVPVAGMTTHLKICQWLQKGYAKKELDGEPTSAGFHERSTTTFSFNLNDDMINKALASVYTNSTPAAADKWKVQPTYSGMASMFTSEQRRRLYNYCIQVVKDANKPTTIEEDQLMLKQPKQKEEASELTGRELEAQQRDMKRRRQSYKGRTVHTGTKTHTQIIGDVIRQQMELMGGCDGEENDEIQREQINEGSVERTREEKSHTSHNEEWHRRRDSRDRDRYSRKRSRTRSHSRQRSRSRHRSLSRKRSPHKDRSRSQHRSHSHQRSRSRDRSRRKRSRSKHKSHHKSSKKKHKRSRSHSRHRHKNGSRNDQNVKKEKDDANLE